MELITYLQALILMLGLGAATWVLSVFLRDVSIVDSLWSVMILGAALVFALSAADLNARHILILSLVTVWALRLSLYLTWRNWNQPEDSRYREIRDRYNPGFWWKSLFIIFTFQALLAWLIVMPLWPAMVLDVSFNLWDLTAVALWATGMVFEAVSDWQLSIFKADPDNRSKVLDKGLWRYTRHPNYFGECLIWWGYYGFAVSVGAWWTIVGPMLMTWLLLKFSGVTLLEKTITERRPAYLDYIRRTNAFIPGRPRHVGEDG